MQIIVADDHPLYREAVRLRLERLIEDCAVLEVGSLDELLARARLGASPHINLVLLDLYMPGGDPLANVAAAVAALPKTPIVLMSGSASPEEVQAAVATGVRGFLPKTMASDLFAMAISMILAGGTYLPAEALQHASGVIAEGVSHRPTASNPIDLLTPRERQVLVQLATGASNKEIGRDLDLAEVTVKLHVRQILRKIAARNRSEAAAIATRAGLI